MHSSRMRTDRLLNVCSVRGKAQVDQGAGASKGVFPWRGGEVIRGSGVYPEGAPGGASTVHH